MARLLKITAVLSCMGLTAQGAAIQRPTNGDTSWQQYVVAPSNRQITPLSVLSTSGNVTNANALVGRRNEGVARLTRVAPPPYPQWPSGTTANASSTAGPNTDNGVPRTYYASNAIDGNLTTFWNDNTPGAYPDILTIISPSAVDLEGVTLQSNSDGYPIDFTVETWDGSSWVTSGTVTGNSALRVQVPFSGTVSTTQVQITVTLDQNTPKGEYTRINELWPGIVADDPPTPEIVLDFGKNIVGFPQVAFAGASDNNPGVRLAFSETQEYLTNISDFTRSDNGDTITPGTDQYAVPATPVTWTDTHGCQHGTQVCADGLHGFRYLKIYLDALDSDAPYTEPYGTVDIESISLNFTAYLGTPSTYTGWFECSDKQLTQFWYNAAYTNEMVIDTFLADYVDPRNAASPNLIGKTVIFDGAKRDRDPYSGDLAVSARTLYLTHQDSSIAAKNVIADLADNQRSDGWIPPASINDYGLALFDYPLWWVTNSWDYILYTNDVDYAKTYYTTLQKVLDVWYPSVTDSAGLLSKGLNNTSSYGDYAFLPRSGEVTYYNALYVLALQYAALIANEIGESSDSSRWQQRAETVSTAINQHLWDASVGAYLDSSTGAVSHPQDGNGIAVIAGVANSSQATSALNYLANNTALPYGNAFIDNESLISGGSTRVYAFISYFDLQARFLSGLADSAIDEIRRLYGWMSSHDPSITCWEGIGQDGSPYEQGYTSMAHGWSTGVVPVLTNFVLGLTPTSPGFRTFSVKPSFPTGLTWAKGQQQTSFGTVSVSWTIDGGRSVTLVVDVPAGSTAEVSIPEFSGRLTLAQNGKTIWTGSSSTKVMPASNGGGGGKKAAQVSQSGGYVTVSGVGAGGQTFVLSAS